MPERGIVARQRNNWVTGRKRGDVQEPMVAAHRWGRRVHNAEAIGSEGGLEPDAVEDDGVCGIVRVDIKRVLAVLQHREVSAVEQKPGRNEEAAGLENAPGFAYASTSALAAIASGQAADAVSSRCADLGLLNDYAASSFEEDWACLAGKVMAGEGSFGVLVRRYPRLREKARLAAAFLREAGVRLPKG